MVSSAFIVKLWLKIKAFNTVLRISDDISALPTKCIMMPLGLLQDARQELHSLCIVFCAVNLHYMFKLMTKE